MKGSESLTVIRVEHYSKVNPAWFTCFKCINSWKYWIISKSHQKVIKYNQLHYFNKVIEKLQLITF